LEWFGHVVRMDGERTAKKGTAGKPRGGEKEKKT
jgi:hypothetical protein